MLATCRALFVIALGLGFAGAPAARADDKKPEKPGNPTVIQIDVSKLPPDVLKELLKYAKTSEPAKPGTKPESTKPDLAKPEPTKPGAKPDQTKPGTKPEPTKPEQTKPGTKPEPTKPGAKPGTKPTEPGKPGAKPTGEQGKPVVIVIHVNQLPPEALKQLLQLAEKPAADQGKPGAKPTGEPTKPGKPGDK